MSPMPTQNAYTPEHSESEEEKKEPEPQKSIGQNDVCNKSSLSNNTLKVSVGNLSLKKKPQLKKKVQISLSKPAADPKAKS